MILKQQVVTLIQQIRSMGNNNPEGAHLGDLSNLIVMKTEKLIKR